MAEALEQLGVPARVRLGASEHAAAGETQANQILEVAVGPFQLAAVTMLGEVVPGNDAKLAELDHRADFRLAQVVARTLSGNQGTPAVKPNLGEAIPREAFWGVPLGSGCRGSLVRLSLPGLAVDRAQVSEIRQIEFPW